MRLPFLFDLTDGVNKDEIAVLAYADNLCFIAKTPDCLQKMFDHTQKFTICERFVIHPLLQSIVYAHLDALKYSNIHTVKVSNRLPSYGRILK